MPVISILNSLPRGGVHLGQAAAATLNIALRPFSHKANPCPPLLQISDVIYQATATTSTNIGTAARALPPTSKLSTQPRKKPRIFEVERKFAPTTASIKALRSNAGNPPFETHKHFGVTSFTDKYFDYYNILSRQGIYLRQRKGEWELKMRKAGDYINSSFEEHTDRDTILMIVRGALWDQSLYKEVRNLAKTMELEDMKWEAEMRTERESWVVDGFKVVIDEMDFGHTVGEVELTLELEDRDGDKGVDNSNMGMMDGRIEHFMREHPDVFPKGPVSGKLSAYYTTIRKSGGQRNG